MYFVIYIYIYMSYGPRLLPPAPNLQPEASRTDRFRNSSHIAPGDCPRSWFWSQNLLRNILGAFRWYQHDAKMTPTWPQYGPNMMSALPQNDPKMIPHDPKLILRWPHYDPRMILRWRPQHAPKMIPSWPQSDPNMTPTWPQNDANMTPKWS